MPPDRWSLLIVGASARSAAYSTQRAGGHPSGVDLFADRDLAAICPAARLSPREYPDGLARLAAEVSASPWMYTGALENYPELVDRIAGTRPLWGNDGTILRAVRDPIAVAESLRCAGLPCPRVRLSPAGLPRDGSWLVKPLASAGGRGVQPLGPNSRPVRVPSYYQERIAGPSLSALFIGDRSGARLCGVTRQWVGRGGARFAYRGSLGPWPVSDRESARIGLLGESLAASYRLVGLFGVDFILSDGQPWPVEINPRYTASVEVLELALRRSLLAEHRRACEPGAPPPPEVPLPSPPLPPGEGARRAGEGPGPLEANSPGSLHGRLVVGKIILFAPARCHLPDLDDWEPPSSPPPFAVPRLGDIPHPGAIFEAGDPVMTLFALGRSPATCSARLRRAHDSWERRLQRVPGGRQEESGTRRYASW